MSQIQRDLLSASVEKLEPLPVEIGGESPGESADQSWIEETEEKAQRGIADAQFSIGQYHFSQGSYEKALQYFRSAEAGGSAQACYQLGVMYYDGLGVPQGPEKGFQYMLKAAHQLGHYIRAGAQYNIGRAYFQGYGVRQSDEEAERWWLRAGEGKGVEEEEGGEGGSVVRAQNALAMFYSRKETLNLAKSFHWHSRAAKNGHLESMAAAGLMSLNGRGCPRDVPTGVQWLKRATERGSVYAAGLLALHYFTSKLFSKSTEMALRVTEQTDDVRSLSLLERQGVALACFTLGRCLQLGQAVDQDLDKALQYFTKAKNYDRATVVELHVQVINGLL